MVYRTKDGCFHVVQQGTDFFHIHVTEAGFKKFGVLWHIVPKVSAGTKVKEGSQLFAIESSRKLACVITPVVGEVYHLPDTLLDEADRLDTTNALCTLRGKIIPSEVEQA